jgi:hypothetical protein
MLHVSCTVLEFTKMHQSVLLTPQASRQARDYSPRLALGYLQTPSVRPPLQGESCRGLQPHRLSCATSTDLPPFRATLAVTRRLLSAFVANAAAKCPRKLSVEMSRAPLARRTSRLGDSAKYRPVSVCACADLTNSHSTPVITHARPPLQAIQVCCGHVW